LRVPRSRRKPAAGEVAAVAARLQRLRASSAPADDGGWSPVGDVVGESPSTRAAVAARIPAAVRGGVFDPGRRGVAVLAVVALLAALGGAWYFTAARPAASAAPAEQAPAATPDPQPAPASAGALTGWPTVAPSSNASLVIDVVGKVAAPGVVELPAGARIRDAITAAGGALPGTDLTALDLASKLSDGQQLFVVIPPPTGDAAQAAGGLVGGEPAGGGAGGSGGSGGSGGAGGSLSGAVALNTATLAELETLPGVGPVLAQHILDWRGQHGRFTSVSQLQQVSGIGPSKYAALAGRVKL
jgi:competence protein ComEA